MDRSDTSGFVSGGAFSCNDELDQDHDVSDTTLRLECFGSSGSKADQCKSSSSREQNSKTPSGYGCKLVLGLGPTLSIYSNDYRSNESSALESSTDLSCFTSAKQSGGYIPSLLLAPRMSSTTTSRTLLKKPELFDHGCPQLSSEPSVISDYLTESSSDQKWKSEGCKKKARGIKDLSISHGSGRRCSHPMGCVKAARGKSGLCIKHGGGKRCVVEGCTRSAEGQAGLCISHGGGRRCCHHGCTKGAQGTTMYCKAHGGGKRCVFAGCTKGSEGSTPLCKAHGGGKRCFYEGGGICPKSVHGGTNFCVAHGGGKRCVEPGCTKSARGRTNCCVKHGGGKRCKLANCTKSAQGSTDFCKAHGGGRRCVWGGDGECQKFARGRGGLCVAHGGMVQEIEGNNKGIYGIRPRLFHGLVSTLDNEQYSSGASTGVSVVLNSNDWLEKPIKRRQLIPPQVLIPSSMRLERKESDGLGNQNKGGQKRFEIAVPEGRVHDGGLLSLLGGNMRDVVLDEV